MRAKMEEWDVYDWWNTTIGMRGSTLISGRCSGRFGMLFLCRSPDVMGMYEYALSVLSLSFDGMKATASFLAVFC